MTCSCIFFSYSEPDRWQVMITSREENGWLVTWSGKSGSGWVLTQAANQDRKCPKWCIQTPPCSCAHWPYYCAPM